MNAALAPDRGKRTKKKKGRTKDRGQNGSRRASFASPGIGRKKKKKKKKRKGGEKGRAVSRNK